MHNKLVAVLGVAVAVIVSYTSPTRAQQTGPATTTTAATAPVPTTVPLPTTGPGDPTTRVLDKVDLSAVPLRDAIERLRARVGVNVFVSWNTLARAGVMPDKPVDAQLANVTLGKALDLILDDASAGDSSLTWVVDEGIIRISTRRDLERAAHLKQERREWLDDIRTQDQLDVRLPRVSFDRTPLWQAIETIAHQAGFKSFVHWRVIAKDAGIDESEPITLELRDVTADAALRAVFSAAGGDTSPLSYVVRQGAVEVTTRDALRYFTYVRAYDVRDLLPHGKHEKPATAATTRAHARQIGSPDDIAGMIKDAVDPDSWRDKGGTVGSMQIPSEDFDGLLIVTQTKENHEKVRQLLDSLRSYQTESRADGVEQSHARR